MLDNYSTILVRVGIIVMFEVLVLSLSRTKYFTEEAKN